MARERLLVIGADAAGMSAAVQARRRRDADDLEIVAFDRGNFTSYSACGIPYYVGTAVSDLDDLVAKTPQQFAERDISARVRHEVTEIDLDRRALRVRDLEGGGEAWEGFDTLMYAAGSVPMRPPVEGIDAPGVFGVQTLDDGVALRAAMTADGARSVVVVGGGYIGLEIAEAALSRGLSATVVDRSGQPLGTYDPDMGAVVADATRELGVDLVLGDGVAEVLTGAGGRACGVRTESGREVEADVVVLGLGVSPNVELARAAGIALGTSGGVAVDRRMRTGVEGVWAAGDCVESTHRLSGHRVVVALGTHANKQGRVAGVNIGGGYETFEGVIGTAITRLCDVEIARTGLSSAEAEQSGFRFVSVTVESTTRAGYFPGGSLMQVKMLAELGTARLLGAQIVGRQDAGKRIDTLAVCCWNGMGVDEILGLDLAYAPPFSPVWDPVLVAARKADDAVRAAG